MDDGNLKMSKKLKIKRKSLGRSAWSQSEIDFLIKNHLVITAKEIAKKLNRGLHAVRARIVRLIEDGKIVGYPNQKWTSDEIEYLKNNYLEQTDDQLVAYFNRPIGGITARAHGMGLKKSAGIKFSKEQESLILDLYKKGYTLQKIATELGFCCYGTVRNFLKDKGINLRTRREVHAIKNDTKVGERVGKLVLLERTVDFVKNRRVSSWLCKCDCGKIKKIRTTLLLRKDRGARSCGCAHRKRYGEISGSYWHRAKAGAKNRNIEFNITIKDAWDLFLKQNRKCALSNVDLVFGKITTASLDRIDSSKGYHLDNIQWIHKHINNMKLDFSEDEFIYFCRKIAGHTLNRVIINE